MARHTTKVELLFSIDEFRKLQIRRIYRHIDNNKPVMNNFHFADTNSPPI